MNKLFNELYKTTEEKVTFKEKQIAFNIQSNHPMVTKLNKIALMICADADYFTSEDCQQEVAYIITKATKKFIDEGQTTIEHLIANLNVKDDVMARYWNYIEVSLRGHIKDELKLRAKKAAEDIFGGQIELMLFTDIESKGNTECTGADIIDNFLLNNSNVYKDGSRAENHFIQWFNTNKETILTKAQLRFINEDDINMEKQLRYKYRKNISKRVIAKYNAEFGSSYQKNNELNSNIEILEEILYDGFIAGLKNHIDSKIVEEIIYSDKTSLVDKRNIASLINGKIDILPINTLLKITLLIDFKREELEEKLWLKENIC